MRATLQSLLPAVALLLTLAACPAGSGTVDPPEGSTAPPSESLPDEGSVAEAEAETEPEPEPVERIHVVQEGDRLYNLGIEYGCPYQLIMEINGITDPTRLQLGQRLRIPVCETAARAPVVPTGTTHVVQLGEELGGIAARYGCTPDELMEANQREDDTVYAGDTLTIPRCASAPRAPTREVPVGAYVIQPGDTLGGIASRTGCSVEQLMGANGLSNDRIRAGDPLIIPTSCESAPAIGVREGTAEAAAEPGRPTRAQGRGDLAALLRARGFRPPSSFKAHVVVIHFNAGRTAVDRLVSYPWNGTHDDVSGWNAASTIKLYSALAAALHAQELGFTPAARVTFHGRGGNHTFTLGDLVDRAIGPSDNIAHNFLVQFAGFDRLHNDFFTRRNGFRRSAILRAYETSRWMGMGEAASLRNSPRITLTEGRRTEEIAARTGRARPACDGAVCTSLEDLGECLRRLMLQEQLPRSEHFNLNAAWLRHIRLALRTDRSRGEEVVSELARSFRGEGVRFYHKAGFAGDWYSDNVYVYDPARPRRAFIVSLAGHPGRSSLNQAARLIGELLADNTL
jgi:LysM repeat protein